MSALARRLRGGVYFGADLAGWVRRDLVCRLRGHRWEAQRTEYPGAGTHYEGDLCLRYWEFRP